MAGKVIIHLLGTSDIGVTTGGRLSADKNQADLEARYADIEIILDRAEADPEKARGEDSAERIGIRDLLLSPAHTLGHKAMPLQTLLARCGDVDGAVLALAYTSKGDWRDSGKIFELLRRTLRIWPDLYGFSAPAEIEPIDIHKPLAEPARKAAVGYLEARKPQKIVLGHGSGSALAVNGLLLGCLWSGRPLTVVPLQDAHGTTSIAVGGDARCWLARQRHFRGLAELAERDGKEQDRQLWEALHYRQIQDADGFRQATKNVEIAAGLVASLDPLSHRGKENSFFDVLSRGEAGALMRVRSWIYDSYLELVEEDENSDCWPRVDDAGAAWRHNGSRAKCETFGKFRGRLLSSGLPDLAPLRFMRLSVVEKLNEYATKTVHQTLEVPGRELLFHPELRRLAEVADARDPRSELRLSLDPTRWSSAPSGRLLVIQCVGGQELRPQLHAVLTHHFSEIVGQNTAGWKLDVMLVASLTVGDGHQNDTEGKALAEAKAVKNRESPYDTLSPERIGEIWVATVERDAGVRDSRPCSDERTVKSMRARITEHLREWDDGFPLRNAEAVVFLGGPGTHGMNLAAMLAAVDWAVAEGCPAYAGSIEEVQHAQVQSNGGCGPSVGAAENPAVRNLSASRIQLSDEQVAVLPGYDPILASVALRQLNALELDAAARTLRRGGSRLRQIAEAVEKLRQDAFSERKRQERDVVETVRRLRLVDVLVPVDIWGAICLAVSVCNATLPENIYNSRSEQTPIWALVKVRDESPTAHGLGDVTLRDVLGRWWSVPDESDSVDIVRGLIDEVARQLLAGSAEQHPRGSGATTDVPARHDEYSGRLGALRAALEAIAVR